MCFLWSFNHVTFACFLLKRRWLHDLCLITTRKRSLGQGNIFCTCLWFCSQWGLPQCMLGYYPPPAPWEQIPQNRHPRGADTPLGQTPLLRSACWEIRSTSRRYASYWNAILLQSMKWEHFESLGCEGEVERWRQFRKVKTIQVFTCNLPWTCRW